MPGMTDLGLLATVVASRGLQPEPVATDALVHLCNTFAPAEAVMSGLLADLGAGEVSGLSFTGQDIDPTTQGRPDLIGSDTAGVRMVLEAKFDAELTAAQTGGAYVGRLTSGTPGALVFLVPRDRMRNVWHTVSQTPGAATEPADLSDADIDTGLANMSLPTEGHTLAVVSWETLLNRMTASFVDAGDQAGAGQLAELTGLVTWRSRTGWNPLVEEDLPQRTGRQLVSLIDMIKTAATRVSKKKIRNGTADGGPGRYLRTPANKSLWVGVWFGWWDHYGPGPVWAQAILKNTAAVNLYAAALKAAHITNYPRPEYTDVLVPIALPMGAEHSATEQAIVDHLLAIITATDHLGVEVVEDDHEPSEEAAL